MRTWSGKVEVLDGEEVLGTVHADLAAEPKDDDEVWWGQLRGAAGFDLPNRLGCCLRLPDGTVGQILDAETDQQDLYHRTEIHGDGPPPF